MKLGICIPVRDALPAFKKMMDSLMKNTKDFLLYVCDDASGLSTAKYIDSLPTRVLVRHPSQQWFTRSSNDVLIPAFLDKVDFIFLLNSDIIIKEQNWAKKMVSHFKDPKVGLVGSLHSGPKAKPAVVKEPNYVTGHCWCLRPEVLTKVGILNEFHVHIESDKEYSYRLNRKGYKTLIDRSAIVGHVGGASWNHNLNRLRSVRVKTLSKPRPIYFLRDQNNIKSLKKRYKL